MILKKIATVVVGSAASMALMAGTANAYTISDTGTGFVGKGEVQLALGMNNKQLQDNLASVAFIHEAVTVTEVSWTCTNTNNENLQVRERTTSTSTSGVVTAVARERNQITGVNLIGYAGSPTTSSTSDGPAVNSCPSGPWTLTTPAGAPETVSSTGGLYVQHASFNGGERALLPA